MPLVTRCRSCEEAAVPMRGWLCRSCQEIEVHERAERLLELHEEALTNRPGDASLQFLYAITAGLDVENSWQSPRILETDRTVRIGRVRALMGRWLPEPMSWALVAIVALILGYALVYPLFNPPSQSQASCAAADARELGVAPSVIRRENPGVDLCNGVVAVSSLGTVDLNALPPSEKARLASPNANGP
jgi:hypothetical protein